MVPFQNWGVWSLVGMECETELFAYKLYFFSQRTVFFSHNKSANSTFSHGFSAKQIGRSITMQLLLVMVPQQQQKPVSPPSKLG
jgi:hypothetical protein